MIVYDATNKTEEQIIQELRNLGLCEQDIAIILKHIKAMSDDSKSHEEVDDNA